MNSNCNSNLSGEETLLGQCQSTIKLCEQSKSQIGLKVLSLVDRWMKDDSQRQRHIINGYTFLEVLITEKLPYIPWFLSFIYFLLHRTWVLCSKWQLSLLFFLKHSILAVLQFLWSFILSLALYFFSPLPMS